jgi:uncharacterized protein (TIGR00645 family)
MTFRYTPALKSAIGERTTHDLSEEVMLQGLVTAGALVALADGEVKTVERAELVSFIERQGFVSTISRVEIAESFDSRVRELEDRYCAEVLVENLRPLIGQSLSSVVVRIAEKVAAADQQIHAGELRALKLLRQIMSNLPAVRTVASSWSEKVRPPKNFADRQCPICGQQVESTRTRGGTELPNDLVHAFFPSLLLAWMSLWFDDLSWMRKPRDRGCGYPHISYLFVECARMVTKQLNAVERWVETLLFAGRWLMAPIYLGLLVILAVIAVKFVEELVLALPSVLSMHERDLVLFILGLLDVALLGSLTLMVAFAGYENFVSKMHSVAGHEDRPDWMGHVDFSGLKLKLISSIVAISAIHLLRTFLNVSAVPKEDVGWQLAIHLGFVLSGVLLAFMDRLSSSSADWSAASHRQEAGAICGSPHSDACRRLVSGDWYQARWGHQCRLDRDHIELFSNLSGGERRAMSFSSLTGFGADIIVVDDAHDMKTVDSDVAREAVLRTCLHHYHAAQPTSGTWLVTFWGRNSTGIHVCLPAEHERNHPYVFLEAKPGWEVPRKTDSSNGTDGGPNIGEPWYDFRQEGDPLWPTRFPRQVLQQWTMSMTGHAVAGQLQQRPTARDGGMFKRDWFATVNFVDETQLRLCWAWDFAATEDSGDYTATLST